MSSTLKVSMKTILVLSLLHLVLWSKSTLDAYRVRYIGCKNFISSALILNVKILVRRERFLFSYRLLLTLNVLLELLYSSDLMISWRLSIMSNWTPLPFNVRNRDKIGHSSATLKIWPHFLEEQITSYPSAVSLRDAKLISLQERPQ